MSNTENNQNSNSMIRLELFSTPLPIITTTSTHVDHNKSSIFMNSGAENILTHLSATASHHSSSPRDNDSDHLQQGDRSPTHAKTPIRRLNTAKNVSVSLSSDEKNNNRRDSGEDDEEFFLTSPPGNCHGGSTTPAPPLSPDTNNNNNRGQRLLLSTSDENQNLNNVSCRSDESTPHRQQEFPIRNLQFRPKSSSHHPHEELLQQQQQDQERNNINNYHLLQQLGGHAALFTSQNNNSKNNFAIVQL